MLTPFTSIDPDARRYALILGLCLALHHGRFGGFNLTPFEIHAARFHIARLSVRSPTATTAKPP